MQLYSCKIRLAGSTVNEVRKNGVPAPEIIMLQMVHGADGVTDVQPTKTTTLEHGPERDRLAVKYGGDKVSYLFGPPHTELPTKLPGEKARSSRSKKKDEPEELPDDLDPTE